MRYATVFALMAGLLVAAAAQAEGRAVAVVEGYAAGSLLVLAIAHGLKARGFAVEEAVRHPRWGHVARVGLAPYHVLAGLTLGLARRVDRGPALVQVAPGLFVGRLPTRRERGRLAEAGVDAVLDLCAEFPHRTGPGGVTAYVPILDGSPPSARQFAAAWTWIEARRAAGQGVLIHCAQGHGRSVTVAAVALCRLGLAPSFDDALTLIQKVRPRARPSSAQRDAALRFLNTAEEPRRATGADHVVRPEGSSSVDRDSISGDPGASGEAGGFRGTARRE